MSLKDTYNVFLINIKGERVSNRHVVLTFEDLKAEEMLVGVKAKEMYRDAAAKAGKWPTK